MKYEKLDSSNVEIYIEYLRLAMQKEPVEMTTDLIDAEKIRNNLQDPFYQQSTSILAIDDGKVLGRIEYHFYGCIQDGHRMAYVNWIYVLPEARHKGIAQKLFSLFEEECMKNDIDQYRLIRSTNPNADKFYHSFKDAELIEYPILNKYFD